MLDIRSKEVGAKLQMIQFEAVKKDKNSFINSSVFDVAATNPASDGISIFPTQLQANTSGVFVVFCPSGRLFSLTFLAQLFSPRIVAAFITAGRGATTASCPI